MSEGKIRWYGWSTDDPERASIFAEGRHCTAIEYRLNLLHDAPEMRAVTQRHGLAGIVKSPLASGLLTGKFSPATAFPANDGRHGADFAAGTPAERLRIAEELRPILAAHDRSMTQGALKWILEQGDCIIPIPGFKTVEQVTENVAAAVSAPFSTTELDEIERIAGRT